MSYLEELLPAFRKGAKIRRKEWADCCYIDKKSFINLNNSETLAADDWELYQEPIDWDYIIKNKCLCWFWDEWFGCACIGVLGEIYKECDLKYVLSDENGNQSQFRNCRPVRRDEVTFKEDREK